MSLINDALNRARAEAERSDASNRGEIPPPPVVSRTTTFGSSVWLAAAGVALALLIWLLWPGGEATPEPAATRADRPAAGAMTGASIPEAETATAVEPTPAPAEPPAGTTTAVSPARGEDEPQAEPAAELAAIEPGATPVAAGVARATSQPAPTGEEGRVDAAPAAALTGEPAPAPEQIAASTGDLAGEPEPAAPAPQPAVIWPADGGEEEIWYYVDAYDLPGGGRIELGGIVWSPKAASAMLNGALLTVGGEVLGLRVIDIGPRTVTLSGQGQRIALQLGGGRD